MGDKFPMNHHSPTAATSHLCLCLSGGVVVVLCLQGITSTDLVVLGRGCFLIELQGMPTLVYGFPSKTLGPRQDTQDIFLIFSNLSLSAQKYNSISPVFKPCKYMKRLLQFAAGSCSLASSHFVVFAVEKDEGSKNNAIR